MRLSNSDLKKLGVKIPTKSKYNAKKTYVDGIWFDSRLEASRYKELSLLAKSGEIYGLTLQPVFELLPAFEKGGVKYQKTTYKADFSYYITKTSERVIEDTKGFKTDVYKLKRKIFEYKYPDLTLREITK